MCLPLYAVDVLIAENKQHLAEKHANNLNEVIEKLNKSVNEIEEVYDTTKQKTVNQYILVQQLQDEIAKSYAENIELQVCLLVECICYNLSHVWVYYRVYCTMRRRHRRERSKTCRRRSSH